MGDGHAHDAQVLRTAAGRHRRRLVLVLLISLAILVTEVVGGLLSGSLALLADAGHMLTDVAGLGLALVAIALAQRPPTLTRTWGLARAEILAAGVNAVVLIGVAAWVLVESFRRFSDPPEVATGTMLVFGIVGLAGNSVAIGLLASAQRESLNMRGAFLEVLSDAVASLGVIVAALLTRYSSCRGPSGCCARPSGSCSRAPRETWTSPRCAGTSCRSPGCSTCTTCTRPRSRPVCRCSAPMSSSTQGASATATHPGCSTRCNTAWRTTSTSCTPPSSSSPTGTCTTSARTTRELAGKDSLVFTRM
jgi:hypothetical protein